MIHRRYLKAGVPVDEYAGACRRADAEGLTLAGYIRVALERDAERQSIAQTMAMIRASLPTAQAAAPENLPAALEPVLVELLQLVRLLATTTNVQAATRITAAVNQQYPDRRIK